MNVISIPQTFVPPAPLPWALHSTLRRLASVWSDFESQVQNTAFIRRISEGKMRRDDYLSMLLHHRQQVIDGACWITRAASNVTIEFADLRTKFIKHAATEHLDYKMLEADYVAAGGALADIISAQPNIGTEVLSSFLFHRANQPDPFDLLGAMFIIEGLGRSFAGQWAEKIEESLSLQDDQLTFYRHHAEHDQDHMAEFEEVLADILNILPDLSDRIVQTAKVTARLYLLQIEEIERA